MAVAADCRHALPMLTCARWLADHARQRPDSLAVVVGEQRLDFATLEGQVGRLAAALRAAGIAPGDRVATLLPNSLAALLVYHALPRIGAVLVPLSTMLLADGLAGLLADAEPRLLIADPACDSVLQGAMAQLAQRRSSLPLCWWAGQPSPAMEAQAKLQTILAAADPALGQPAEPQEDDVYNLMYTSGTTGLPKGIIHTHRIRAVYALLFSGRFRIDAASVVLQTGAIVFNGAFVTLMAAQYTGARYVLDTGFDAGRALDLIEAEGVTHCMMVPAQVISLLDHPAFDPGRLRSLRMLLTLGAPMPAERREQWMRLLPGSYHELYGLTEGFVTILDAVDAPRKPGSVGCAPPLFHMRIVDEAGQDLPPGENGEILGRGPILMPGYYRREAQTAQAIVDGWLHTGDIGHVDEQGFLYLVDRKKDMIDSGGVKVWPRDLEEIAARHPAVAEVAVFAMSDPRLGEVPAAAVRLRPGQMIEAEALRTWINERVAAKYQRLRTLHLLDDFPRNAAGKILKRELRARYGGG